MSETVLIPGGRDVRASLDAAGSDSADDESDADACVVACPPHPQHRGHRGDERLRAVSDFLTDRGIDCLRFDYGDWDEGYGETTDADNAVAWARERYDRVGLFGFSFGGCVALVTAASNPDLRAVAALAPAARLNPDTDAVTALDALADAGTPTRVVHATRDTTADWEPVVERARELGLSVAEIDADHFFVGKSGQAAEAVGGFLSPRLGGTARDE
ncbi:CocE/NonD family hydrolase [Haloparvum sedimenti]|uniref:CocE/NonD family hydrolase n=1 Tax=Haloparvum sedimenti TaxID=1678448 RepID=UPI00071E9685|nr:CocE/NonD family hydrolase [Haloparvum sedimenti]